MGSRYQQVCMQHDFKAESLMTADGQTAPLPDLSFGKERNLVVFDDKLVHTDPERLQLACEMLARAAESCQILLLSCHPERFVKNLPDCQVLQVAR